MRSKNVKEHSKRIFFILIGCIGIVLLAVYNIEPGHKVIHNIGYETDAAQHIPADRFSIEWWYFDGNINEHLSFILVFYLSTESNYAYLVLYDAQNNTRKITYYDFPRDRISIHQSKCKIKMGNNSIVEKNGVYSVVMKGENFSFKMRLTPTIKGFALLTQSFLNHRSYWPWICMAPRAKINGVLDYDGKTIEFDGTGYHDHNYFPEHEFTTKRCAGGWYWGRFFTENYTIIVNQSLKDNEKAILVVFKNDKLIQSSLEENIVLSKNKINAIRNGDIPTLINFTSGPFSISIENEHISFVTPKFNRFVNRVKMSITDGKKETIEMGSGLSEIVHVCE